MPEHPPRHGRRDDPSQDPRSLERGHELRDLSAKAILSTLLGLFLTGVLIHYCLRWQFDGMLRDRTERFRPLSIYEDSKVEVPEPRIDTFTPVERGKLAEEERRILTTYGWVDRSQGIARIPIERAMDLLARRGFPARTPDTPPPPPGAGALPPWVPPTIEVQMFQGVPPPLGPPGVNGRLGPLPETPPPPPGGAR